jgi:hypothetical protein
MRVILVMSGAILMLLSMGSVQAEIFTCKDAQGNTVYTDSPGGCENAEAIKVDTLPTLVPSKSIALPPNSNSSEIEDDKAVYKELVITSPSHDSTFRDNQGSVTVNFRASPALQTRIGHQYVVTLDGTQVYTGTSTIAALKNVDRGTHTIVVKIIDPAGSVKVAATPVKFTLQRFSALQNSGTGSSVSNPASGNSNNNNQSFPSNSRFNRPAIPPSPATN